jgi:hypothetical protein
MARFGKLYEDTRGRLSRVLSKVRREPTGVRPTQPVRIKLGDLPAPLRAVVRDESHGGLLIEAELPWLTVGSAVQAEFTDGREKAGRVHWFGVDATRAGSARLRIFVDLSSENTPESLRLPDVGELEGRPSRRSWALATAILVVVASSLVYIVARRPPQPALLPTPMVSAPPPPRAPAAASVPKEPVPPPSGVHASAPKLAAATASAPRAKPKRRKR